MFHDWAIVHDRGYMYFWNIKELKRRLIAGAVAEHEVFFYFLAVLIIDTFVLSATGLLTSTEEADIWDYIDAAGYFVIVVAGAVALYHRNGGRSGQQFLVRYFSLLWVLGVRFLVYFTPVYLAHVLWILSGDENSLAGWMWTVEYMAVMLLYYARLLVHMGDVAAAAKPAAVGAT